ncbi:hypothetical protein GKZ89_15075 [Bacillus mangrovi]|uniref:Uncharacterized protein n=1 Tax=Metabacillus mangrovi TaxID=1491830 RepID=A0A7X2S6T3_9BACI|nr:hypothetical protein [Metabacillus mangrovi]MTH54724.1 hypothetical protein [Metabacillus mangrovi]
MRKILFIVFACTLLAACDPLAPWRKEEPAAETAAAPEAEAAETDAAEEISTESDEEEDSLPADESPESTEETVPEEEEETPAPEAGDMPPVSEQIPVPTVQIASPYDEKGNIKEKHTEKEIVEKYMDDKGRIFFGLDENPIRSIISGEKGNVQNITNYSDAFIDIGSDPAVAYEISDPAVIESVYQFYLSNPPVELEGKDPSEYRTWEEATNLERGIMKMIYLIAPVFQSVDYMAANGQYDDESFSLLLAEFEKAGAPMVLIPAPQTPIDLQLFENMRQVNGMWGQLGKFEDPAGNQEEFMKQFLETKQETNNLIARLNYALSEKME